MIVVTRTEETLRAHVHGMWSSVASHWAENADLVDRRGVQVTAELLARSDPRRGNDVLELACGPGGAGLAAAERVGPDGHVVLSDVVPAMTSIAAARAAERGLSNVSTATIDFESIDAPDASYDIVLCREGLMFAVEPDRALAEIHRVLRPGGRFAAAVWGSREDNPWLGLVFDAVGVQTGSPIPPPGIPGPFALSDPARLHTLLTAAGFAAVRIDALPTPLHAPSFESWWGRATNLAGPLAVVLSRLPDTTQAAITDQLRVAVAPYATSTGLELPGLALVTSAVRP